jgi:hypothetical protein
MLLVEAGSLEYQAMLLCESLRTFGGRYRHMPICAISPRPSRRPSPAFARFADAHAVEYLELALPSACEEYAATYRIYASAYRATRSTSDVLVVVDSDTLFLREPDFLLDGADVMARPVDVKGICTTGPDDPFDLYWRRLCQLGGLDHERLPFVDATVDGARVKASYNGGLVAVRRHTEVFEHAADLFDRAVHAGLRPHANHAPSVFASTGYVGDTASAWWGTSQSTLSVAIWRTTARVRLFEPGYNVPLHSWDQFQSRHQTLPFEGLIHLHYHWLCAPGSGRPNPLLDGRLPLPDRLAAWLGARIPFPADAALNNDRQEIGRQDERERAIFNRLGRSTIRPLLNLIRRGGRGSKRIA